MIRREAQLQAKFNRWARAKWRLGSALIECKCSRTTSIPFSAVSEKQITNLRIAEHKTLVHTFSDFDRMGTPADAVILQGASGFIVLQFYRPGNKEFFIINVDTWVQEAKSSKRKSLTEERAREIGMTCFFK